MTPSQVRQAFPNVAVPSEVSTLNNGAKCELAISDYDIGPNHFKVCFFFVQERLDQVTLTALQPSITRFEALKDLLRVKYGPEIGAGQQGCKFGLLTMCEAKWVLSSGSNVSALYMDVRGTDPVLNINYQTRMAGEASKL